MEIEDATSSIDAETIAFQQVLDVVNRIWSHRGCIHFFDTKDFFHCHAIHKGWPKYGLFNMTISTMNLKSLVLRLAVVTLLAVPLYSANSGIGRAEDAPEEVPAECTEASEMAMPQQTTNMCLGYKLRAMERDVQKDFDNLVEKNKADYADDPALQKLFGEALVDGQKAFENYRQHQCDSEGYMAYGGSLEGQLYGECQVRLLKARLDELKMLEEGLGN